MITISKNTAEIILICLLFLFASIMSGTILVFGIIGILFLLFLYFNFSTQKNTLMLPKLTLVLLLFQNTLIGLGSHYGISANLSYVDYLTQIPTICIFVTGGCVLLKKKTKSKTDLAGFLFILLIITYWFIGDSTFISKIIYARNFVCFYMAYLIGEYYIVTEKQMEEMIEFYIKLSFGAAVFGMIAMALGTPFYMVTGVKEIYAAKNYTEYYSNGMPGNYMTKVFGRIVPRLASFYYEPVNFSYFIALGSIFSFEAMIKKKNAKNIMKFVMIFVATILTFGKSGIMIACIGILILCFRKFIRKFVKLFGKRHVRKFVIIAIIIAGMGGIWYFNLFLIHKFGSYAHYKGMYNGITYMKQNPLGYGLGTFGNISGEKSLGAVGETGLLVMGCQIGIQGLILFIAILLSVSAAINRNSEKNQTFSNYSLLFTYFPIVLLLFCVLQENTITPQCITQYMLFSGALSKELGESRDG